MRISGRRFLGGSEKSKKGRAMAGKTKADKKHDFLLEEYKQAYEHFRHLDNISNSKEVMFAVAAFGILALVIRRDIAIGYVFGGFIVSISLYIYHVIASAKMHSLARIALRRAKTIESSEIGPGLQTMYEKQGKIGQSIRCMRCGLATLLIILWLIVLGVKYSETHHSTQKHWPRHNQTRHHRPHR